VLCVLAWNIWKIYLHVGLLSHLTVNRICVSIYLRKGDLRQISDWSQVSQQQSSKGTACTGKIQEEDQIENWSERNGGRKRALG